MRRRTLFTPPLGVVSPAEALACDICFAHRTGTETELLIVRGEQWSAGGVRRYPAGEWTPVGIVVVPGTHNVYGDGTCGIMSLVPMSCDTPETGGGVTEEHIIFGLVIIRTTTFYNQVVVTPNSISNIAVGFSETLRSCLPLQQTVGGTPTRNYSPYAPSPYVGGDYKSGDYNPSYGTTAFDTSSSRNVLADFDGRGNTDKILLFRGERDYSSWKPISDNYDDLPAVSCCDMFRTIGTEQGDWYLPAAGELGYIMPRFADINDTISKLNAAYNVGYEVKNICWTSSSQNDMEKWNIDIDGGEVLFEPMDSSDEVRSFIRL